MQDYIFCRIIFFKIIVLQDYICAGLYFLQDYIFCRIIFLQEERKRSQSLQMHWEGAEEGDSDRFEESSIGESSSEKE